jgi:hypothetical protein
LVVLSLVPKVNGFPRELLRLDAARPVWFGIKVAAFTLVAFALLLSGLAGTVVKARTKRAAVQWAEERAEMERRAAEANGLVADLTAQAEHALQSGDVDSAIEALRAALRTAQATELQAARALHSKIAEATDGDAIRQALLGLGDAEFDGLQTNGTLPEPLRSGYAVLDRRAEELARSQMAEAAAEREERRARRLAEEEERQEELRKAAEAERIAEIESMLCDMQPPREGFGYGLAIRFLSSRDQSEYGTPSAVAAAAEHLDSVNDRISQLQAKIAEAKETRVGRYVAAARALPMYEMAAEKIGAAAARVEELLEEMRQLGPVTDAQVEEYRHRMKTLEEALLGAGAAQRTLSMISRGGERR